MLNYTDRRLERSTTRDISLDGAFVQTENRWTKKDQLELAIQLPTEGQLQFHRFRAHVVRVGDGGAGVVFDNVDTEAYAALLDLVFSRQGRGLW